MKESGIGRSSGTLGTSPNSLERYKLKDNNVFSESGVNRTPGVKNITYCTTLNVFNLNQN